MLDLLDKLATLGLGVTGPLFYIFHRMYGSRIQTAERIKEAQPLQLKDVQDLLRDTPDKTIAYGTLEGIVMPYYQKLTSTHGTMEGVVQYIQKVEHKSKRVQGYWSDAKKILQDTIDIVPFKLVEPNNKREIRVLEAENADLLQDELTVTFDHFEPGKTSLLQSGIDRIFGEVTKGFQDTEKMLLVGTNLRAIGKIYLEDGTAVVGPPADGSKYILTKLSKGAVIRKFESQASVYKVLMLIFGTLSTGLVIYLVYKFLRRYQDYRRNQAIFAEIRAANERGASALEEGNIDQQCVVCLASPRNTIIMDCRHVCVCSNCAELLPSPKKCPVCRHPVQQFLPLFNA